jgi:hypothetical protein
MYEAGCCRANPVETQNGWLHEMPISSLRVMTVVGLLVGAVGIAILWSAGVPFPFYPPPGIVILAVGALVVVLVRRRWSPIVGTR